LKKETNMNDVAHDTNESTPASESRPKDSNRDFPQVGVNALHDAFYLLQTAVLALKAEDDCDELTCIRMTLDAALDRLQTHRLELADAAEAEQPSRLVPTDPPASRRVPVGVEDELHHIEDALVCVNCAVEQGGGDYAASISVTLSDLISRLGDVRERHGEASR
jgi:hypothetical protein